MTNLPRTLDSLGVPVERCAKLEVIIANGHDATKFTLTPDDPEFAPLLALFQDRKFSTFPFHPRELIEDAINYIDTISAPIGGLFPPHYTWWVTFFAEDGRSRTVEGEEKRLALVDGEESRRMGTAGQADWWEEVWDTAEDSTAYTLKEADHWLL